MKKLLLSGLALFLAWGGPTQSFAMLGETKAQSASRYGKPFTQVGNVLYYKQKGYVICQWFDSQGIAEVISYFRLNGTLFTEQETARIFAANLPPGIQISDWIEQNDPDTNCRMWLTLDSKWVYESGSAQLGTNSKKLYPSMVIGSAAGAAAMLSEMHGNHEDITPAVKSDI